jgi:hypothetical protein
MTTGRRTSKARFVDGPASASIADLVRRSDHRTLAVWAADCAECVLPLFQQRCPSDDRPRKAIETARDWARTGVFGMSDVRGTSLASHAAAREAEDEAARFAARAAGHAIATAHVPTHSIAAASYAAKAVWASDPERGEEGVAEEREWQHRRLVELCDHAERV